MRRAGRTAMVLGLALSLALAPLPHRSAYAQEQDDDASSPIDTELEAPDSAVDTELEDDSSTPVRPSRSRHSTELWDKTDEELAAEGWEVRGADRTPGSVGCGLAAVVVSLVWRGWGHRCARDEESHIDLLLIEAVAVGLLGAAVTIAVLSNDADTLNPLWSGMYFSGVVLFSASYFFDLLGTFKGSARALYPNLRGTDGITPRVLMRLAFDDPFGLNVIGGIELPMQYSFFWARPEALFELERFAFWRVGSDVGFRVWQGEASATYLGLGNQTRFESFREAGFDVLTTVPYVEFSLDVGDILPHLGQLFFVNRIGYGFEFYAWEGIETDDPFKDISSLFVLESELSMNFLENFNFTLSYRVRPDLLVGGLGRATRIFDAIPTPGVGIVGFDLSFLQENGLDINVEINLGTLAEVWIGAGKQF